MAMNQLAPLHTVLLGLRVLQHLLFEFLLCQFGFSLHFLSKTCKHLLRLHITPVIHHRRRHYDLLRENLVILLLSQ